jgi:uncharacterized membrane protein YeaQ/YmgE (transglycosylase-associated protein family)
MISSIFFGIAVGLLARWIMPRAYNMGCFMTMLLGLAGSFVANKIGSLLGWYKDEEAPGWIMSIGGALLILFLVDQWKKRSGEPEKKS